MEEVKFIDELDCCGYPMVNLKFQGINIGITFRHDESIKHIAQDYKTLCDIDFKQYLMENFLPWLKADEFKDRDDEKILEGLKLYEVTYTYGEVTAKYSPTHEEGFFGQFEFAFESGNEYTKEIFDTVALNISIQDGMVYLGQRYDI